jgi:hypothetical protein
MNFSRAANCILSIDIISCAQLVWGDGQAQDTAGARLDFYKYTRTLYWMAFCINRILATQYVLILQASSY